MLSKPKAAVSAGKLSAGRMSTPSRSRMVLLYSARLSRRAATRPASGVDRAILPRKFGLQPARDSG